MTVIVKITDIEVTKVVVEVIVKTYKARRIGIFPPTTGKIEGIKFQTERPIPSFIKDSLGIVEESELIAESTDEASEDIQVAQVA